MKPAISAVMCVFNGRQFIREAIYSILNQNFRNFELIVINDGSTDDSEENVKSFHDSRIRYFLTSNHGYSSASNFGIQLSNSEFIAKCDDDDIAHPGRFQLQYEYLMTHNDCVAVGSWANWIDEEGRFLCLMKMPSDPDELKKKIPVSMPVPHAGSMYRKKALAGFGGYKDLGRYFYGEDNLLMIDLAKAGSFANIQSVLSSFRITSGSNTEKSEKYLSIQNRIIEEYFKTGKIDEKESCVFRSPPTDNHIVNKQAYYLNRTGQLMLENPGQFRAGFLRLLSAIRYEPLKLKYYKNAISALLKPVKRFVFV